MSLHEFPDVVQGSEEWDDLRRGIVTASVAGRLVTPSTIKPANNVESRSLTAQLVAERITGWTDPSYVSADMESGWENEPRAVEIYSEHWTDVRTVGFMIRDDWGYPIGYSPDGLSGTDGIIEVKSRRPKKHLQTILAGEVPAENMAQIQCGLLVSGREWCDYVSYCGGLALWVKRVEPDPKWHEAIVAAVAAFEKAAEQMASDYHSAVEGMPKTERVDDYYPELKLS